MKTDILNNLTRTFHKGIFVVKKHSPEILVVTGVIGTVASAVMACKATTKVSGIVEETKAELDKVQKSVKDGEITTAEGVLPYTEKDAKDDTKIIYVQTGLKYAKLYGPSVALGVLSIGAILAGHNILRQRNLATAAALTTVTNSFKEYRGRVIERFGKELDQELKYNIKKEEIEEVVVDDKGKEKIVKKTVDVIEGDPNDISEFAVFFDPSCIAWEKDPELNMKFLKTQQAFLNDLLRKRGWVTLNEVYDAIGVNRTKAGMVVGWVYNEENPVGDNYIDFGLFNQTREAVRRFVNKIEPVVLLDFNVDGNIYDLM